MRPDPRLRGDDAPSRVILGAGVFALTRIEETAGVYLAGEDNSPETIAARWEEIAAPKGARSLEDAFAQTRKFVALAAGARDAAADEPNAS